MIHKIGILTSGGDAPGMNNAIRAVVRAGTAKGLEVYGVLGGYRGLVENRFLRLDRDSVEGYIAKGGTFLRSARLPEFKELPTREIAVKNLKKEGIEALVVVGGDGSYMGAKCLTEMGINCVGLPGTIDNDIASSDYTIGFDTALNTVIEAIDRIKDTNESHSRCHIVEIMGNRCGDLTVFAAVACGADEFISVDHPVSEEKLIERLSKIHKADPDRSAIVLVSEKTIGNVHELAKRIQEATGFESRATVLGHIQRGGVPTGSDRILASEMGVYAVERLLEGKGGLCIGLKGNKIVDFDIMEALALKNDKHEELIRIADLLK